MIEHRYDVHGVGLAFRTNDQALAEAVHGRLRHFGPSAGAELDFELLVGGGEPVDRPSGRSRRVYEPVEGDVAYYPEEDVLFVERGPARLACDAAAGVSRGTASDSSAAELWLLSRPFLTLPLIETLKRRGLFSLHAAVAAHEGRGVVVAGSSGAGKSTLALALARAGLDLLSDDMVFLRPIDGAIEVCSFPDEVDVTDETLALLPELRERASAREGWPKKQVPVDAFGGIARVCVPEVVVFCRVVPGAAGRLERLDEASALLELSPNVLLTAPEPSQRHLAALGSLTRAARCYRLEVGRDLERVTELLRAEL